MPLPTSRPVKLTYEDLLGFPEDGRRHELLDGEHVVTPAPSIRHQTLVTRLLVALARHLEASGRGTVLPAPVDVLLSESTVVEPDLVYVSDERSSILEERAIRGGPDLVVEVLSESSRSRDEVTKRHLYEKHGVAEYWIVDPVLATVKVFRGDARGFAEPVLLAREKDETLESPLLPGFALSLTALFA